MTPPLKLDSDGAIVVSATQLEAMQTCPAFYEWRYLYRRVRRAAPAARAGGKAFDAALQEVHGQVMETPEVKAKAIAALHRAFESFEVPEGEYRTLARYEEVLHAYIEHYKDTTPWEVIGVQMPLIVDIGEVHVSYAILGDHPLAHTQRAKVRYRFIPDVIVRLNGALWIVDDKTANQWNEQRQIGFENSGQAKGYVWALTELVQQGKVPGTSPADIVAGFIVNAIVIREPYKSERKRYKEKPREEFHRVEFTYTSERLEKWRTDTLAWVESMLGWAARDQFPQSEKHCSYHYGKPCPYLEVCMAPQEQQPLTLSMDMYEDYGEGPWLKESLEAQL